MSTIVYRIAVLLGVIVAEVPVGTNLALFWLLWALISGRFAQSGCRLPGTGRPRPPGRRRATLWSGSDVWVLDRPVPPGGLAQKGPAGRSGAGPCV